MREWLAARRCEGQILARLVATHQVAWSGRKLKPMTPSVHLRGGKTVSELLVEDRG